MRKARDMSGTACCGECHACAEQAHPGAPLVIRHFTTCSQAPAAPTTKAEELARRRARLNDHTAGRYTGVVVAVDALRAARQP